MSGTRFAPRARALLLTALGAASSAMAADDATQDAAPLRATVPVAAAEVTGPAVTFREVGGAVVNSANSSLPVAAEEGLWRHSKGLPIGARIRLKVSDASQPADGHSSMHLTVSLLDHAGQPVTSLTRVRIETSLGRLQSPGGAQAAAFEIAVPQGVAELDLLAPVTAGEALIRVASGAVRVQGQVSFVPELRPLIAVGIVETGLSFQHVDAQANAAALTNLSFEDSLRHWGNDPANGSFWSSGGRAAGFVKGTVWGDTLLTGAYDSNKIAPQRFFADVDPNQFFPVTGDASLVNYDARSTGKLFLRLDRGPSHMLYGDFQTLQPADTAWLGSYARTLTGFTAHYETPAGPRQRLRCPGDHAPVRRRAARAWHLRALRGFPGERGRQFRDGRDPGARPQPALDRAQQPDADALRRLRLRAVFRTHRISPADSERR